MRVPHCGRVRQAHRSKLVQIRRTGWLSWLMALAVALSWCVLSQTAGAKGLQPANAGSEPAKSIGPPLPSAPSPSTPSLGYSLTPSNVEPYAVCPPEQGQLECMAIAVPTAATRSQAGAASPSFEGTGEEGGFSPSEIREAYGITETGGSKQTVAIVDAYNDPNAETDLKTFREHYKLYYKGTETACTESNGCFKKVDQNGETETEAKANSKAFPANEAKWGVEISIDVDMVSAVCPQCNILLVEAETNKENSEKVPNLFIAENEAAALKATEISNSWDGGEFPEETSDDNKYFNHEAEGIPIMVAAGDSGYGVSYPAASKDVISVGGTTLKKATNARKWEETVWTDTGSGCSRYELKREWQGDANCPFHRTANDVAAVANEETPVSIYDSYGSIDGDPVCSAEKEAKKECWLLYRGDRGARD
jgi:hypothetical protein